MKLNESIKKSNFAKDVIKNSNLMETSVEEIAKTFARNKVIMLDVDAVNEFLGIDVDQQVVLMEVYPVFMNAIVALAMNHYLKQNKFEVLYEKNFKWGEREVPMQYGEMTVARDKMKNLIIKGMLFTKIGDIKAVIKFEFADHGPVGILEIIFDKKYMDVFSSSLNEINRYVDELDYMRGEKISASGKLLNVSEYGWDDVVLEEGMKEALESNILNFLTKGTIYLANNVPFKRGVILQGPPGTGKTLIGKVLANKTENATFILSTAKDICGSEDVSNLFNMARRLAPSVIFMEDIDFFGQSRQSGKVMRVTGELLSQLDGIEDNNGILVVATTNHPEMIDDALMKRPGRFDVILGVGALCLPNRIKLLTRFLDGRQKTEDVSFNEIAEMCDDFTGSHIKDLANDVIIRAINEGSLDENNQVILLKEHFNKAIERIKKHMGVSAGIEHNIEGDDECDEPIKETASVYTKGFNGYLFNKELIKK